MTITLFSFRCCLRIRAFCCKIESPNSNWLAWRSRRAEAYARGAALRAAGQTNPSHRLLQTAVTRSTRARTNQMRAPVTGCAAVVAPGNAYRPLECMVQVLKAACGWFLACVDAFCAALEDEQACLSAADLGRSCTRGRLHRVKTRLKFNAYDGGPA